MAGKEQELEIKKGPYFWLTLKLSPRQLDHLKMLCRFHMAESKNHKAKNVSRRLLTCLEKWPEAASESVMEGGHHE